MAHGWERKSHTPSLGRQKQTLDDIKKRIAERKGLLDKLTPEQIALKASKTYEREGPLQEQNLRKATRLNQRTEMKTELGQKILIKSEHDNVGFFDKKPGHQYGAPGHASVAQTVTDIAAASIKRQLAIKKEALSARFMEAKRGGSRFSQPGFREEDKEIVVVDERPKPRGFDKLGRGLDRYGNAIDVAKPEKTLKINKRVAPRAQFKTSYLNNLSERQETQEEQLQKAAKLENVEPVVEESGALAADVLRPTDIAETSMFFDPRLNRTGKGPARERRSFFDFHDEGKFIKQGKTMRQHAQLKELQKHIEGMSKKTGIQQSSKLAAVAHSAVKDTMALTVNELDWWDRNLIPEDQHNIEEDYEEYNFINISNLIEHPIEMAPPMKNTSSVQLPVYLTKQERKKIRRLRRREEQKEEQEKIRLGLIPAPEAKVRLANMMKVLGNEQVVDPTKVEMRVREQMAQRMKKHMDANNARALTKDERRAKKEKKMKEDLTHGVQVNIYLVKDLSHAATRWKLKENAKQLYLTGCCITTSDHAIIVIEGGKNAQRKFRRLMMYRIKWRELAGEDDIPADSESKAIDRAQIVNSKGQELCKLVWTGERKTTVFKGDMAVLKMQNDIQAKEFFDKHNITDYWHTIQAKLLITGTD